MDIMEEKAIFAFQRVDSSGVPRGVDGGIFALIGEWIKRMPTIRCGHFVLYR